MTKTKYAGVFERTTKKGDRTFYIRYRDNSGKQVRQVVGTAKQGITAKYCERILQETKVKLRLGEAAPIKNNSKSKIVTLNHAAKEYWLKRSEAKSIKNLKSVYRTHIEKQLGYLDIQTIDENTIQNYTKTLLKTVSKHTGRLITQKTANNALGVLSAILTKAVKQPPKITKLKTDNTRDRYLNLKEINILTSHLLQCHLPTAQRLLLFTHISLSTGGRLTSVLGIQGKHINRSGGSVMLHNYKTESTYTAFLPDDIMDMIPPLVPGQYLFEGHDKEGNIKAIDPKQIQRPLQGILNELFNSGLDAEDSKHRVVVHTLRHTFASHLAIKGVPIQKIMKLMDHSDIKMTLRYAKLDPDSGKNDVMELYK